jgi:diacylglycerol kinase family enzyme
LVAFGVSGYRSYGDHKHILPDAANVCAITNRSLLKKLQLKPLLYRGGHVGLPGVLSLSTRDLMVEYNARIPLQTDGQALWLGAGDFPCRFEIVSTFIQALRADRADDPQAASRTSG